MRQYTEKMHTDLAPTKLRGYVQLNNGTDPLTQLNTVAPAPTSGSRDWALADDARPVWLPGPLAQLVRRQRRLWGR